MMRAAPPIIGGHPKCTRCAKAWAGTLSPLATSGIAFAVILGGVFAGVLLRKTLPQHHLADDAKDVVRLGTGLIGTIAALVLGLLISSANSSYNTASGQVNRLAADIVVVDQLLNQFGPAAHAARDLMRRAVGPLVDRIWRENGSSSAGEIPFTASGVAEDAFAAIVALAPQSEAQRALKERAIVISSDLVQTRLQLFAADNSIPAPFLAVMVFWLAIIFASFSLFAKLNPTLITSLFVFALSAAGAIFLILELSQPFSGLLQISSAPLRNALAPL